MSPKLGNVFGSGCLNNVKTHSILFEVELYILLKMATNILLPIYLFISLKLYHKYGTEFVLFSDFASLLNCRKMGFQILKYLGKITLS